MDAKTLQSKNHLLAALPLATFELLRPHLKHIELPHQKVLFEAGDTVDRVYFPHNGIISIVVAMIGGETIEVAMIGRTSFVGGPWALDDRIALNNGIVQIAGEASVMSADQLCKIANANISFRTTLIRHEQALFAQAQQTAGCNITHDVEARLARWLLRSRDITGTDDLAFTQEFLGQMLGVGRTSVSIIASKLQEAGLIKYRRGHVKIENLKGLQEVACECYAAVRAHYLRLVGPH
jgi:CRP-like cAMP-binding protein